MERHTTERGNVRMRVIAREAAGGRPVFDGVFDRDAVGLAVGTADRSVPLYVGVAGFDAVCGGCLAVVVGRVPEGYLARLVVRCPACGAYNEVT